ncbi:MAG: T9SS type A sorting domain-containing protein [Saprospiraceae bacterium]
MFSRKLLLIALFTAFGMARLIGQQNVHLHGTVTDSNGNLMDSVNVVAYAIYSDSTIVYESLYTDANGHYSLDFAAPQPNVVGTVEVSMVDCFSILVTQFYTVLNSGPFDLQADFVYCANIVIDSCSVYILEESNPGALNSLTAYTFINANVSYLWNTGATTQTIYPQASGVYTVEVAFPWGCTGIDSFYFVLDTFPSCFGYISTAINSDGTYYLQAFDFGTAPFTYLWSTGETSWSINGVLPGTYCVTMTDATACVFSTCVILDDPNVCTVGIFEDPAIGGLTAIGSGVEPITFYWSTGEVGATIYPNAPGTYCVTAVDTTGCSAAACYKYGVFNDSCYVYISVVYVDSNTVALQAFPGIFNGYATYLWNTGDTLDIIYPQDPTFQYCVTATNASGCTASACFDNSQSCYAWVDVQYVDTVTAVLTVFSDPIFGWGSNTATYAWSNGDSTATITVHANGEYCVTATLSSACVTEACVYVDFDSLQYACATWVTQFQDPGTNQWYAQAYSWGYGTFSYLWTNGDTNDITPIATPNEYVCVTATNTFGCVSSACVDTFFNPCQVYIDVSYFNGGAVLTAQSWYGGAINQGTFIWSNGQPGNILTVIQEGTYCVIFNSFNGCSSTACIDVYFNNVDSCGVYISTEPNPGGVLYTANAWGVPPFMYQWSNGATEESQIIDFGDPNVCVTVTDAVGCVSSACSYDTINGGVNIISGFVFADSLSHLAANVFLFSMNSNGEPFQLLDSTRTGEYGYYSFSNLANGAYLVKSALIPGTVGFAQYIPTYHLSSTTWEDADPSIIPNWLPYTTDISMKHTTGTPGGGVIGGGVLDPHHIVASEGNEPREIVGLPNVEVILKNEAGEPLDFTISVADGSFKFPNLSFGTYRISYDIPGIHSPDVWVTITQEDPERLQVTLIVNQGTTAVDQPVAQELQLYPNPAKNEINIKMPVLHATYDVQIVDMQGRVVYRGSVRSSNGILPVEVGQLSSGLFHINLKGENQNYYSRFLKLE